MTPMQGHYTTWNISHIHLHLKYWHLSLYPQSNIAHEFYNHMLLAKFYNDLTNGVQDLAIFDLWISNPFHTLWRPLMIDSWPEHIQFLSMSIDRRGHRRQVTNILLLIHHFITVTLQRRHMSVTASQITGISTVCSTVCSGRQQQQYQSSAILVLLRRIYIGDRWIPITKGQ